MRTKLIIFILVLIASTSAAEEITGEIDISFLDPYDRLAPGFCGSYWPEIMQYKRMSMGAGLSLSISNRFNYETTVAEAVDPVAYPNWYEFEERLIELVNFDFFLAGRWKFAGLDEDAHWKGWLTLHAGAMIQTGNKVTYLTQYQLSAGSPSRTDVYVAPGILVGIGNFIVGYRHWIYTDESAVELGDPARTLGALRIGYRFTW
jgi:hypothetical protein